MLEKGTSTPANSFKGLSVFEAKMSEIAIYSTVTVLIWLIENLRICDGMNIISLSSVDMDGWNEHDCHDLEIFLFV